MVIPERTRRVHRVVVPFFVLRLGGILLSLVAVFLVIIGVDYLHVLRRIAENKRLKGENFKLRQEIQQIRNKVDTMESTVDRVRNYAKKLQLLTGQGDKALLDVPTGDDKGDAERGPAAKPKGSRSDDDNPFAIPSGDPEPPTGFRMPTPALPFEFSGDTTEALAKQGGPLEDRVERLGTISTSTEASLSLLQGYFLAQTAVMTATPSLLPVAGWISSSFGYRRHPYDGSYRLHAGVDISAEPGTPVRAPAHGLVIYSGYREGYGKCVVVDHGYGIRTLFGHLSKIFVTAGARVKRGELLSEVGSTGTSTGPHLHYEIRKNGVPVNPATFFSRARF